MMNMKTNTRTAFNGLVEFQVYPRTLKTVALQRRIESSITKTWGDNDLMFENQFAMFCLVIPLTQDITFADEELPLELEMLREYWQTVAALGDDYPAMWGQWQECIDTTVSIEWWKACDYVDPRLLAPKAVRVSEEEAQADPN